MAKFSYSLQNVLNIKYKLEDQCKMQFALTIQKLTEEEKNLFHLKERKVHYETEAVLLRENSLNVRNIIENKDAIGKMDEYIKDQLIQVRIAERNVELARKRLEDMMKERKTYEKLREKAFEDFLIEIKSEEGKEIDELTSYTYGQKRDE